MKKINKLLAFILSLMLISSCIIIPAQAEQTDNIIVSDNTAAALSRTTHTDDPTAVIERGECGRDVYYELHESGILYVYGTGYLSVSGMESPFCDIDGIEIVVIENGLEEIGNWSLAGCSTVKRIEIPKSVITIGNLAFENCPNLLTINVSPENEYYASYDGVLYDKSLEALIRCPNANETVDIAEETTFIGEYSFQENERLKNVVLPENVSYIEGFSFNQCTNLECIEIPKSMERIAFGAFSDCKNITDVYFTGSKEEWDDIDIDSSGNQYLKKAKRHYNSHMEESPDDTETDTETETEPDTGIPKTHDEDLSPVAESGECGRDVYYELHESGILYVYGTGYFCGLGRFSRFCEIDGIEIVVIEEGMEEIGSWSFAGCSTVKRVEIPKSVINIESYAFESCQNLLTINVSPKNRYYTSYDGVLYDKNFETLMKCPDAKESVDIAEATTIIDEYSFQGCERLESVIIPENVFLISWFSFKQCTNLARIEIPKSVESIGYDAFDNCTNITDVYFTGSKEEWDDIYINSSGNRYLKKAKIHYNSHMGESSDDTETDTETKTEPDTDIPKTHDEDLSPVAESGECGGDVYYELHESGNLYIYGSGVMDDFVEVEYYDEDFIVWAISVLFQNEGMIINAVVEDGVTNLGSGIFNGCDNLSTLILADSVVSIGEMAFEYCGLLSHIEMPNSVTQIGNKAFSECKSLEHIDLPDSVKQIGQEAFYKCVNLKSIIIPDSVKVLDIGTFAYCENLESVVLHDNLRSIESGAFYSCESLLSITIPKNVYNIAISTFSECTALKNIYVDSSSEYYSSFDGALYYKPLSSLVLCPEGKDEISIENGTKAIGEYAVSYCKRLETADIPGSVQIIGEGAFYSCERLKAVNISFGVKNIVSGAFGYCNNLENIELPDSVENLGSYAFEYCEKLKQVKLSKKITVVDWFTFMGCCSLKNIEIPNGVTKIGDNAFSECSRLETVSLPDSVKTIEKGAFSICDSLKTIALPDSVETIGPYAFMWCDALESIKMSKNVTYIGHSAFTGCSALENVVIPKGVTVLEFDTFYNCESLKSIELPAELTCICENAFCYCDKLEDVYYTGTEEDWLRFATFYILPGNQCLLNANVYYNSHLGDVNNEICGDVNGDGKVTAKDSMSVQRYVIKLADLYEWQLKAADADKDGKVTSKDAMYILRCSINLAVLPIEK